MILKGRKGFQEQKGHREKTKGGQDQGWEVGMAEVGESSGGKWRQLYLNNNKKQKLKKRDKCSAKENYMLTLIRVNYRFITTIKSSLKESFSINVAELEPCLGIFILG